MRRSSLLLACIVLLGTLGVPVQASLDDQLDEVRDQISDLEGQLRSAEGERTDLVRQVVFFQRRLDSLLSDLETAKSDLSAVELQYQQGQLRLGELEARLEERMAALEGTRLRLAVTRTEAAERARHLYMSGGRELTEFVFAAADVMDVALGLQYAAELNRYSEQVIIGLRVLKAEEQAQVEAVGEEQANLEEELAGLEQYRAALDELAATVEARTADIEEELASQQSLLAEIDRTIEHFDLELDALADEQAKIEQLLRDEQSGGDAPGVLLRPVPGPITSPFGWRTHPIFGTKKLHTGVDFSAAYGQEIKAAASGRVILAQWYGGYGNAVLIDHGGGLSTLYAHQSSVAVGYGQQVEAGQVIGYVGSTGFSTGPHLHFEVREWSVAVDPMKYL